MANEVSRRLFALSLAALLPSLGTSIANVALPTMATAFQSPFEDVQWVVVAYLLAVTTLIVAAGRLGDMLGRRRLLLIGVAVFSVASALCAAATGLWILVAARALQGMGAAIMMALTMASVGDMVPAGHIGRAMGLLGTVSAVGTALGPSLGGVLISAFGWPAVFVFMALAGAATLLAGWAMFPPDGRRERVSIHAWGLLLLATALGTYALATTLDPARYGVAAAACAGLAVVTLVTFVMVERAVRVPLVRLALLRDRALSTGLASMALVSAIVMATLVVGPFYLSGAMGLAPITTGLVMSTGPAVAALVGVPAGRLVDRLGPPPATMFGLLAAGVGCVLMIVLPGRFGVGGYVASLALTTAGYALFQAANSTAIMKGVASDRRGVTSALLALARNLGLITGASAMGAVFTLGSRGLPWLSPGPEAGMELAFATAAGLAALALALSWWGGQRRPHGSRN